MKSQVKSKVTKPLLAGKVSDVKDVKLPCIATPKVDGIRALIINGQLISRTFKPIRNETIKNLLEKLLPEGSDGEIIVTGTFQDVSSTVMSASKGKEFKEQFTYYWFDYVAGDPNVPYRDRIRDMMEYVGQHPEIYQHPQAKIIPLPGKVMNDYDQILDYEKRVLEDGFEGVMLRSPLGKYKMGRSTLKEGILLKLKRFEDAEATVVAVYEMNHNENEKQVSETGSSKRSQKKEGLVAAGKLGALGVINDAGEQFNIGSGFTDKQKCDLWAIKDTLKGKLVKYRYFKMGSKDAPRFPTFLGFRDPDDM